MVALDTIKPHLTPDFVTAFKALGKQVGYSKLGRAIAYMQLPTEAVVDSTPTVSRNDNGGKPLPFCIRCGQELDGAPYANVDGAPRAADDGAAYCKDCWAKKDDPPPIKIKPTSSVPLQVQCFTPCEEHKADWEKVKGLDTTAQYLASDLLKRHWQTGEPVTCTECCELTSATARVSVAAHIDTRKLPMPHSANKWWYQQGCPHDRWNKASKCEQCGRNQLAAWVKACG